MPRNEAELMWLHVAKAGDRESPKVRKADIVIVGWLAGKTLSIEPVINFFFAKINSYRIP